MAPSVGAVQKILETYHISVRGKRCAVFGYGILVGKPITHWLLAQGATVSVINEHTKDPASLSRNAEIIIAGVGKPHVVSGDMVPDGATVIDFGYTRTEQGIVGDVDFEAVAPRAAYITPVPGGVGPIVVATALANVVTLCNKFAE